MDDINNNKNIEKKNNKFLEKFMFLICILIVALIIFINVYNNINITKNNKFTEQDWQYMYKYIDDEYGKGEHFHIISEKTDKIQKHKRTRTWKNGTVHYEYETLGIKATFIGYFDSQEELYAIVFSKYLKDQPYLKNGKAGQVICTTINTTRLKEEYFKENKY